MIKDRRITLFNSFQFYIVNSDYYANNMSYIYFISDLRQMYQLVLKKEWIE